MAHYQTPRLILFALALLSLPALAITPEQVLSIREVSELRLAAGGGRVAFVVREPFDPAKPSEPRRSAIWIAGTSGTDLPRPIGSPSNSDSSPRWSPDGRTLAFLSEQVYLHRDRAIAQLTSAPGGVEQFEWSPDGKVIAYTTRGASPPESDPIDADTPQASARLWMIDVATREAIRVPHDSFEVKEIAWSPDGREIALSIAPSPSAEEPRMSLILVDRVSGRIVRTLSEHVALPGGLRWSPDGKLLTFFEASPAHPYAPWMSVVPARGGAVRSIMKDYRGTVLQVEWLPDSERFMAEAIEGTDMLLLSVHAATGEIRRVAKINASQASYGFGTNGATTAFLAQTPTSPADVWVMKETGVPRRLTDFNPHTRAWRLGAVSEVTWTNTKDKLLRRGVLITPSGYEPSKRYPTVVLGHLGDLPWWPGFLASWWSWGQLLASNGYVVFLPNYRGVTGEGAQMHATLGDWGAGLQDLLDGVDAIVARGIADPDHLGIAGWSNGGFMTAFTIGQTTRFKAAVAEAPHIDLFSLYGTSYLRSGLRRTLGDPYADRKPYDIRSPITYVRNVRTPTLLLHGINDPGVPVGQAYEFRTALKELGVPVKLIVYPRERHGIREYTHQLDVQRRVLGWFDEHLKR